MALTAAQFSACIQSYWYMWLTNGISGLIFMGVSIGIAAFFLKKHGNKKSSTYHRPPSSTSDSRRAISPSEIDPIDDRNGARTDGKHGQRNISAGSTKAHGALEDNDQYAEAALQSLNGVRRRYNSPPLELNDQLSEIAQRWAEQLARTGKLEHSPAEWRHFGGQTLGENYTASFQAELTGEKMVKKWMKEGKRYMFGYDGRKDTENFTQLVWRSSQEIGLGRARSEDGNWWYGVAVFDPPGNIPNQYAENVLLPPE